jgi:hypothetical protein
MKSADDALFGKREIVLNKLSRQAGFLEIGGFEGFEEIPSIIRKSLRLYQDDPWNGKGFKSKGHFIVTLSRASRNKNNGFSLAFLNSKPFLTGFTG